MIITSTMIMMWMLMMIDLQVRACKDDQEAVGEEKDQEEGYDQEGVGVIKVDAKRIPTILKVKTSLL